MSTLSENVKPTPLESMQELANQIDATLTEINKSREDAIKKAQSIINPETEANKEANQVIKEELEQLNNKTREQIQTVMDLLTKLRTHNNALDSNSEEGKLAKKVFDKMNNFFDKELPGEPNLTGRKKSPIEYGSVEKYIAEEEEPRAETPSSPVLPVVPSSPSSQPLASPSPDENQANATQAPNENLADRLAPVIKGIKDDLQTLLESRQKAVDSVEESVKKNGHVDPIAYSNLQRINKEIKDKEIKINKELTKYDELAISHIRSNIVGIGTILDKKIEVFPPQLLPDVNNKVQEMRKNQLQALTTEIKNVNIQLNSLLSNGQRYATRLENAFKQNTGLDPMMLRQARAEVNQLRTIIDEINNKIIAFDPSADEMKAIKEQIQLAYDEHFNKFILANHPYKDPRVSNLVFNPEAPIPPIQPPHAPPPLPLKPAAPNAPPLTPPTPEAFPLGPSVNTPPSAPLPVEAMQSQAPHPEIGSAEARIGGTVISRDWLNKRQLAESINSSIKQGMETAMMHDPEFTKLNTKLHINNVHLSTPGVSSSGLKGLKISSDDKKIDFTATPESVSGNGNPENLRAMSIAIVKNLETRIANGEANLKINLGNCQPQTVKDEFSKLINEQLDLMKERNQSDTHFTAYNIQALKLPEIPQVKASAVINESTPTAPSPPPSAKTPTTSGKSGEVTTGATPAQHL